MNLTLSRPVARRRGRPRDPRRDRAILDAAREVLADRGFTGMSMDEVARTAGVGKDTLYRRWSSKEELVGQLLRTIADESVACPDLDDPRLGLLVLLQDIVRVNTQTDFGAIVAGVVGESARNPKMAATFTEFWAERRRVAATLVRQIVGPDMPDQEFWNRLDLVLAPIYYRLLLTGDPLPDEFLWELVLTIPWPADTAAEGS